MSESDADKKRNKLGYQRISVACAHCRRRKIRCVMAEGDPQNRCQNCIRLNKECIFHPVEQQAGDTASVTGQTASTVSPSPQDLAAGQPFEPHPNSYTRLAPLPSNAPPGFAGLPFESPSQGSQSGYDYRPHYNDPQWPATEQTQATGETGEYWTGPENFASQRPLSPDARSFSFSAVPAEQQWQMLSQQGRSMSYGHFEGQQPFQQNLPVQPLAHHSTYPIDTHSASALRGVPGPQSAPVHPTGYHPSQQYAFQQAQFPTQGVWYGQHPQAFGEFRQEHEGEEVVETTRPHR